jgi:hypothetical protein
VQSCAALAASSLLSACLLHACRTPAWHRKRMRGGSREVAGGSNSSSSSSSSSWVGPMPLGHSSRPLDCLFPAAGCRCCCCCCCCCRVPGAAAPGWGCAACWLRHVLPSQGGGCMLLQQLRGHSVRRPPRWPAAPAPAQHPSAEQPRWPPRHPVATTTRIRFVNKSGR